MSVNISTLVDPFKILKIFKAYFFYHSPRPNRPNMTTLRPTMTTPSNDRSPDWNVINNMDADIDRFRKLVALRRFVCAMNFCKRVKLFRKRVAFRRFVSAVRRDSRDSRDSSQTPDGTKDIEDTNIYAQLLEDMKVECRAAELRCRQAQIMVTTRQAQACANGVQEWSEQSTLEATIRFTSARLNLFRIETEERAVHIANSSDSEAQAAVHLRAVRDLENRTILERADANFISARTQRYEAQTRLINAEMYLTAMTQRAKAMAEINDYTIEQHVCEMQRLDLNHEREERKLRRDRLATERLRVSLEHDRLMNDIH